MRRAGLHQRSETRSTRRSGCDHNLDGLRRGPGVVQGAASGTALRGAGAQDIHHAIPNNDSAFLQCLVQPSVSDRLCAAINNQSNAGDTDCPFSVA